MAPERKIDYLILGLLNDRDLTGYEIKKVIDTTLSYFWSSSYASIYPALKGLVDRGLAIKRKDTSNKRKKLIYSITDEGRRTLKAWLTVPVEKDELRYETLLKLFFGDEQGPEQTLLHIEALEEKVGKELAYLLSVEKVLRDHLAEDSSHTYYLLTVRFGIKSYQCYLEWCQEARETLMTLSETDK
ncbi:MAG: PadR family transcriptional regulator [Anaerolineaceae bacterium]|jgi:DNA-binding PadR family transcriptional regulator